MTAFLNPPTELDLTVEAADFSSQPLLASWVSPRSVEVKVDGMDVEVTSLYPGPAMLWKVDLAEPPWAGAGLHRKG